MNETSAIEWIQKAWHNLSGAKLFYKANHYTDVTAVELHYAVEKLLKAFLAYENKQIPKTHDLIKIYYLVKHFIDLDDYITFLNKITKYHIEETYPAFQRNMPSKKEIKEVLDFGEKLFDKVCVVLDIDKDKIID